MLQPLAQSSLGPRPIARCSKLQSRQQKRIGGAVAGDVASPQS